MGVQTRRPWRAGDVGTLQAIPRAAQAVEVVLPDIDILHWKARTR